MMAFGSDDLLRLAEQLLGMGTEAAYRSAISRAYYAVYWEARELAGIEARFSNSHSFVWDTFASDVNDDGRSISDIGTALKRKRASADYHEPFRFRGSMSYPATFRDAESVIQEARDLLQDLRKLE